MAALLLVLGSGAMLAGAFGFQVFGGLAPCELCLWQRWAHAGAIAGGVLALALSGRPRGGALALGVLALLAGVGIAVFHAGVEQEWWEGLASCGGGGGNAATVEEMLTAIEQAPLVRCGDIAWSFLGLSMAVWNAVVSALLAGVVGFVATRRR
ncbi:disulfide bond formation protein B [Zavarzinia compransoris]|uniref:disulfide bond formation protein B n=1 Tax=Zavarzinia marina TaxID=2911065 RepID=UPI001F30B589|nr:disulfide bond formation protein B [Zavarzinia marina]MCF4167224.1 disulfide bond formation protein B [Zavarzinia marina]